MIHYILKKDDGTAATGKLDDYGEEFTEERQFKSVDDALDYLDSQKTNFRDTLRYRIVTKARTVCEGFFADLCAKADKWREERDRNAEQAGITVETHCTYEHQVNLQCYSNHFYSGDTDSSSEACRQFWAYHNHLCGAADGVYELGFSLCWNRQPKHHEVRGECAHFIIDEFATY